jgi:transposase
MPRGKKFTAEQIIGKLRESEVELARGKTVPEVVRKLGVTEQTYYRWKREYGGLRTDPAKRLQAVEHVRDTLGRDVVTERRACRVLAQARNTQRRKACVADDEPQLVKRIVWMASEYGRYGYRRITALLRSEGWWVNHKRVERIWRQEGLKVPARHLFVRNGVPDHIRSDNGSEFTATRVREWLGRVGVKTLSIEPGSPWENGSIESFNGKLRDELLARELFDTLLEAKVLIERWRKAYNTVRPHSSLGYRPPAPESRRPCPLGSATPHQANRGDPLAGLP